MSKLKICPFCGGKAKLMGFPKCERKYVVICENEQCMASVGNYSYSKEKAIEVWNTRKPIERIVERLEEYRDDFMNDVYEELREDADNCRANRIIDRFDEVTEIVREEGGMNV